jgi:hypothetical protein
MVEQERGIRAMPEKTIIENCSPTLAGMKPANLISLPYDNLELAKSDIREMNGIFVRKGLRAVPLSYNKGQVLLYIYRPDYLQKEFGKAEVRTFLQSLGYDCTDADRCVIRLGKCIRTRKSNQEFPHEIGLFLGYPLEDVEGFMQHRDVGCKCIGCWRVYGDAKRAERVFRNYRSCTSAYLRSWEMGRSLEQLTV